MIQFQPDWPAAMIDKERFQLAHIQADRDAGTGARVELTHLKTMIMVQAPVEAGASIADQLAVAHTLYPALVNKLVDGHHHEYGSSEFAKMLRCIWVNKLIAIISSYGRCFFYNAQHDRTAQMVWDGASVYLIDEKSGRAVALRNNGDWQGFGHNGTLRDLVLQMRDYVVKGTRIDMVYIGLESTISKTNAWGYPADQLAKCKEAARRLPCMEQSPAAGKRGAA